jgi:primosomal protein N' (replication factor Y)
MQYICVHILNGLPEPLWYVVPEIYQRPLLHSIVQVPLRNRVVPAYVIIQQDTKPNVPFALRTIEGIEPFPADSHYIPFIKQLATYHMIEPTDIVQRIKQFLKVDKQEEVLLPTSLTHSAPRSITLNQQQNSIYQTLHQDLHAGRYQPTVLHGVTGSGKTEIYIKLLIDTYYMGRTSIVLLPEVTLAIAFEARFKQHLGSEVPIISFHSATSLTDKRMLWQHILAGKPILIIGVHLPIMLPIPNVGLIIVDEEHEVGYQEKKYPRINSKQAALMRAHMHAIPIILGSATPSLITLHNVKTKGWRFVQLTQRFAGSFPRITVTSLTDKQKRKNFWISTALYTAIAQRLKAKEQTILFLNRRGHSFFVQCGACSFIFSCKHCSVSLTLHDTTVLQCHYCGYKKHVPPACTSCNVTSAEFISKGIGTQKLVQIIAQQFPHARIARADLDTSSKKKSWQKTMQDFADGHIDILIGTQTITKGYDFPRVTLVGIIWADLNLHFPHFNASETTLQQLIQVSGRAGRHSQHSDVIVQTMGDHEIYKYLNETNYLSLYAHEMDTRKELGYPPYKRLCLLEIKHTNELVVDQEARAIAYQLQTTRNQQSYEVTILGPSLPPVHKIQKVHMRHIYLKANRIDDIHALMQHINKKSYKSMILFMAGG